MLVIWGQFAHCLGLPGPFQGVKLHKKTVQHSPQTKVLEFLVSMLAGLEHMQDISRSAHPLDQDLAVAKAWGQPGWADNSGVSRTLAGLTQAEAEQMAAVLEQITQPILSEEVMRVLQCCSRLSYDGDLTDRPVSNTSTTYPGVAYGHLGDGLRLGYQAALVSMHSPSYGCFWLSVEQHPGDTVSCTQAEAIVCSIASGTCNLFAFHEFSCPSTPSPIFRSLKGGGRLGRGSHIMISPVSAAHPGRPMKILL